MTDAVEAGRSEAGAISGHMLVVDDNRMNRMILSRALTQDGHSVATAENGQQALDALRAEPFDVVLLDIEMPVLDGFGVLQALKADAGLRHVPVIVVSALEEMASTVRCIEMGAEDYLPKPFDPVLLRARVNACLEKKRLRDQEVRYLRAIEAEQQRSDGLLHAIFPVEIVAELKATSAVKPRRHDNVAVLFCDIVGFTQYCHGRPPQEVVGHLQQLFEAYEDIALRHRLEKIKTSGDAFMATAGLLAPADNPVLNCVRAGFDMIEAARTAAPAWEVRVGVHCGEVMAGVLGRRQYLFDIWGDTVNTAERVESAGVPGAVTLSRAAWERVRDRCDCERVGVIPLKGKGEQEVFRVRRLHG